MPTYDELDTIIGKMKRAAIDCWMADQGFHPVKGNEGTYCKWGWAPYQYFRPADDGTGGGKSVGYGDGVTCEAQFDEIRAAVDSVVSKWLGLPDGTACTGPRDQAGTAAGLLGSKGADANSQSGAIATSSGSVNATLTANPYMRGSYRGPFLMKYYTKFSSVQEGLGQASVILQANYAAQAALWPAAREDVAKLCDNARSAWAVRAETESAQNSAFQLAVATAAVTAIGSVVTATTITPALVGMSLVTAGMSTAVAAAAGSDSDVAAEISGGSYGDILTSLRDNLEKLSTSIGQQEEALSASMDEAVGKISGEMSAYNLDAVELGEYSLDDDSLAMDETDAGTVSDNMGLVEESLASVISAFGSPPASNPTPRNWGVGSSGGSHASACSLHNLTERCLELTHDEYVRGHGLFDATVADFFTTDGSARQTVADLLAEERDMTEVDA